MASPGRTLEPRSRRAGVGLVVPGWRHRAARAGLLTAALGLAAPASAAPAADERFTFYGLGPAAAGQALAQAEAALGQPLVTEPAPAAAQAPGNTATAATAGCHYRGTARQPGVRYAVDGAVITRIETRDARYATVSGVHVGDTVDRANRVYGRRLSTAPHPYFDRGRVLTIYSPDRQFALVMEANNDGRIITLRGGRLPEVGWLEGCS